MPFERVKPRAASSTFQRHHRLVGLSRLTMGHPDSAVATLESTGGAGVGTEREICREAGGYFFSLGVLPSSLTSEQEGAALMEAGPEKRFLAMVRPRVPWATMPPP